MFEFNDAVFAAQNTLLGRSLSLPLSLSHPTPQHTSFSDSKSTRRWILRGIISNLPLQHRVGAVVHIKNSMLIRATLMLCSPIQQAGEAVNLTEYEVKERIGGIAVTVGIPLAEFMPAILNRSLDM